MDYLISMLNIYLPFRARNFTAFFSRSSILARAEFSFTARGRKGFAADNRLGFTLIEMVIATGLFSVMIVLVAGILMGVTKVQRRVHDAQFVLDNLRFSLESMTKEVRTGNSYKIISQCSSSGLELVNDDGETVYYYLNSEGKLMRHSGTSYTNCSADSKQVTADELEITNLTFNLKGADPTQGPCDGQPMTTIVIEAKVRNASADPASQMSLQTTVMQRLRDIVGGSCT